MPKLIPQDVADQIKSILADMKDPITLLYFSDGKCQTCVETGQLLEDIAVLNPKINLVVKDSVADADEAKKYDVRRIPGFVVLDKDGHDRGVKFSGIPAGHEINSFLAAIMELSGATPALDADVLARIRKIDKPVDIKVFVTLSCPHCPGAVQTAHLLAMHNPLVKAEMIEAQTFQEMSRVYKVSGVPKIVVNDKEELLGDQPIESFLNLIERL
ncbi:MAG: thioredoxin family protein [Candidatus Izemoplasmatales bacterium]